MRTAATLLIAAATLLSACTLPTNALFHSLCTPPCWQGVTPGETTREELVKLAPTFPYYEEENTSWWDFPQSVSPAWEPTPLPIARFNMDPRRWNSGVSVLLVDNVVSRIEISSSWSLFGPKGMGLSLSEAIDAYGEPTDLILGYGCGGDLACLYIYLVYPEIGTVVAAQTFEQPPVIHVEPELYVRSVAFMPPEDTDVYLGEENSKFSMDCLRSSFSSPWQGFVALQFPDSMSACED